MRPDRRVFRCVSEVCHASKHFCIPVRLTGRNRSIVTQAMVDSGANTIFLSDEFVRRNQVHTEPLPKPVRLTNADGSANAIGMITHEAVLRMTVGDHTERVRAAVAASDTMT